MGRSADGARADKYIGTPNTGPAEGARCLPEELFLTGFCKVRRDRAGEGFRVRPADFSASGCVIAARVGKTVVAMRIFSAYSDGRAWSQAEWPTGWIGARQSVNAIEDRQIDRHFTALAIRAPGRAGIEEFSMMEGA